MKCKRHPSANVLPKQEICFLCQDIEASYTVESDRRKFEYERMAQHIKPGIRGIRTKGQYQRLLKREGLTDDLPTKDLMRLTQDTGRRERVREEKIHAYLQQMDRPFREQAARLFRP